MATFAEHKKILKFIETFKPQLNKMVEAAGVLAVNHFTKSFSDGGFTDESWTPWKRRKIKDSRRGRQFSWHRHAGTDEEEGKRFKVKEVDVRSVKNRAILVKSGRLRRSLRSRRLGNLAVKIMTDVPYARRHNDGLNKMPKRQFIGYSGKLNRQIIAFLDKNIKKQFNK
jgi:phage gpG-like protein